MSRTTRLWLGVGLPALAAGGGALWLVLVSNHEENVVATLALGLFAGWSFVASGLVAWTRRPENLTGKLLVAAGFAFFVSALAESNHSIPFTIGAVTGAIPVAVLVHLLLSYPTGELRAGLKRWIVIVGYVAASTLPALSSLYDADPIGCPKCPDNAILIADKPRLADLSNSIASAMGLVILAVVIAALVRRWRAATPAARRSMRLVFLAGGATISIFAIEFLVQTFAEGAARAISIFAFFGFTLVPVVFLLGLLHSRLTTVVVGRLAVELGEGAEPGALRETLAAALRDPTLELAYWLPERGTWIDIAAQPVELPEDGQRATTFVEDRGQPIAALVHDPALRDEPEVLQAVVTTARLALENERLHAELRAQLLEVERLAREQAALRRVATLVASEPSMDEVLESVASEVGRLFGAQSAQMWRLDTDMVRVVGCWHVPGSLAVPVGTTHKLEPDTPVGRVLGRRAPTRLDSYDDVPAPIRERVRAAGIGSSIAAPIEVGGALWGAIIVSKATEQRFPEDAEQRLSDFAALFSQAIANAHAREELQASRARIVEAGDEERRRLERNLHDGAQQRLVSISLALRLAQSKLAAEPETVGEILGGASTELAQALEELRELARGIHPAILTDRGLRPALEALAARAPLPVEIEDELDGRLPAPVEAAAYYVVSESLANVVKYAQASAVHVRLTRRDGLAGVEVVDDGVGGADPSQGTGLRGLADRIEALSGRLQIASEPGGGTRVVAEIPVRS